MKITTKGFTLLELMVVVAIIGILSSVLYASFTDARLDAKNRSFQAALKETQLAIEVYKAQNGQYPDVACNTSFLPTVRTGRSSACGTPIVAGLVPEFIGALPDPTNAANDSCDLVYAVDPTFSWYKLTAENCHTGAAIQPDAELARCPNIPSCSTRPHCSGSAFENSYAIYSLGAECEQ